MILDGFSRIIWNISFQKHHRIFSEIESSPDVVIEE
jgi:hypothetical protein